MALDSGKSPLFSTVHSMIPSLFEFSYGCFDRFLTALFTDIFRFSGLYSTVLITSQQSLVLVLGQLPFISNVFPMLPNSLLSHLKAYDPILTAFPQKYSAFSGLYAIKLIVCQQTLDIAPGQYPSSNSILVMLPGPPLCFMRGGDPTLTAFLTDIFCLFWIIF